MTRPTIETVAQDLLRCAGINTPPVSMERVARHIGARIQHRTFADDTSGMVYRDGQTTVIGVNDTHSDTRQRFTIAHEIGHLQLHAKKPLFVEKSLRWGARRDEASSLGTHREEVEANSFAAALLMPKDWVLDLVYSLLDENGPLDEESLIARLAEEFEVSAEAVRWRLVNLGILFVE